MSCPKAYLFLILLAVQAAFLNKAGAYLQGRPGGSAFFSAVNLGAVEGCSAVKISEKMILTAAHCVWPEGYAAPDPLAAGDQGYFLTVASANGRFIKAYSYRKVFIHPSWRPDLFRDTGSGQINESELYAANDIAIIETTQPIRGLPNAKISLRPILAGDHVFVGGFGCGSPVDKMDGMNPVRSLSIAAKTVTNIQQNTFSVGFADTDLTHFSMACNGDSGSPAFRWSESTRSYQVVGLNSRVDDLNDLNIDLTNERVALKGQHSPRLYLMKLNATGAKSDTLVQWLRSILPLEAFSKD